MSSLLELDMTSTNAPRVVYYKYNEVQEPFISISTVMIFKKTITKVICHRETIIKL